MDINANYWSSVEATDMIIPDELLEKHASVFNNAMHDKMVMKVKTSQIENDSWESLIENKEVEKYKYVKLFLSVPSMKGYTLTILDLSFKPSSIYPCSIDNVIEGKNAIVVSDSEACETTINQIIYSSTLKMIVSNLLAQV